MPTTSEPTTARESLAHLAAGELGPLAAWRLRRQIARDPLLAREWAEMQSLWHRLQTLQTLEARPVWSARAATAADSDRPMHRVKGISMTPRIALAACGVALFTITGTLAARSLWFNPYRDMADTVGRAWYVETRQGARETIRGQVKLYDTSGKLIGSYSSGGDQNTPRVQDANRVSAIVSIDGERFSVTGAGRHLLRSNQINNSLLGFAELIPETPVERATLEREHDQALGHQKRLGISSSAIDGWGKTSGFFGEGDKRLDWTFTGVGEICFRDRKSGEIIRRGIALPVDDTLRRQLRKQLGPQNFAVQVAPSAANAPDLALTVNGGTEHIYGFTTIGVTLPDGTLANVEILPANTP